MNLSRLRSPAAEVSWIVAAQREAQTSKSFSLKRLNRADSQEEEARQSYITCIKNSKFCVDSIKPRPLMSPEVAPQVCLHGAEILVRDVCIYMFTRSLKSFSLTSFHVCWNFSVGKIWESVCDVQSCDACETFHADSVRGSRLTAVKSTQSPAVLLCLHLNVSSSAPTFISSLSFQLYKRKVNV